MTRKLIIPIAALFLCAAPLHAQDRTAVREQQRGQVSAAERAQRRTEHMRTTLQLTEDQVAKVQAINLRHAQSSDAARTTEMAKRQQQRQEMNASWDAEMKAVLTPEQYQRLQEQRRAQAERREDGPSPQRPVHQE